MISPRSHTRQITVAAVAVVCFAATLAAVWSAPRVSGAFASWLKTPPVRAVTLAPGQLDLAPVAPGTYGSAVVAGERRVDAAGEPEAAAAPSPSIAATALTLDPGTRFTLIGLTCTAPAAGTAAVVWLRASEDGSTWGPWYSSELERGGDGDAVTGRAFTEPVWTGSGSYVQVAAASADGDAGASRLDGVKVVAIDTEGVDTAAGAVVGVVRRVAAFVAGVDLAPPALSMTSAPTIVTRAQWGADESLRSGSPSYAPVQMAFVHHTDGGNSYTRAQAPGIVRGIYYYHTKSLGWSDVGYNFLIDRYGTIYEGRYGGVTKGPIGAQVLGFNTGSTGVSIMGDFTHTTPPAAAVSALKRLLAWKLDVHHVDPRGSAVLTCGFGQKFATGQRVAFPAIAGHRQANYTSCPGDRLYALLPAVRKAVAGIGLPKIYGFTVSKQYVSPNGDGVQDKTDASFTVSEVADWRLDVKDASGATLRSFKGTGASAAVSWAGKDDSGRVLPDGVYTLVAGATSTRGAARAAVATVRLDTVAPVVKSAAVTPDPFSPNGDGSGDAATLRYTPAESGSARVWVLDGAGDVVRRLTGWRGVGANRRSVAWDGRVTGSTGSLAPAAEARYNMALTLKDLAGNSATFKRAVSIDRTLGFAKATPTIFSPNGDGTRDTIALGFRLTRRAGIVVQVTQGGTVLRRFEPGQLAAGPQSVVWDGQLGDGTSAASGSYRFAVTATGAAGTTSVSAPFTVDRYTPRLSAPATASVAKGRTAKITYTARDPYSPTVKVWVTVTDPDGTTVATLALGWVKQGAGHVCAWKPPARKVYTLAFRAVDRGGNHQNTVVRTVLTVR